MTVDGNLLSRTREVKKTNMPLAKRSKLPDNEALEVGKRYTITGVEQKFDMKNGGKGVIVVTSDGLRRTTSKVIIGQISDAEALKDGASFPITATVEKRKNKAGAFYQVLVE